MKTIRSSIIAILVIATSISLAEFVRAAASSTSANNFSWVNLQSDIAGVAQHVDPNLVNPWGMALSSSNAIWVADNGKGVSTNYNTDGTANSLVVTIPPSASNTEGVSAPTGIAANNTSTFKVTKNGNSLPSTFIFVSEDGAISGYALGIAAQNAHRFETSNLIEGMEACLQANVRLVTSQLDHELVLTEVVVKLIGKE